MSKPAAMVETRAWYSSVAGGLEAVSRRNLFLLTFLAAIIIYAQFQFWKQPSTGDRANWDYFAQVIVRGGVPYRDVVNIKTPLSAYLGAAAIATARPFGMRDVIAIRIAYILMAALTVALTFLVALEYFDSRRVAALAAIIMAAFNVFAKLNSAGVQPKTPMVLFGLITLWAIMKDKPILAGVSGMLSALSWQPGLLFAGVAGLAFSRYFTSWRDLKAARVIAGASLPLALALVYFWATGALRDFYLWTFDFNLSVYGPRGVRSLSRFFARLSRILTGTFQRERIFFYIAALGIVIVMLRELLLAHKNSAKDLLKGAPRHAVVIAPLIYFLFCIINMQGNADLIPLLPFVAMLSALAIVYLIDAAADLSRRVQSRADTAVIKGVGFATAAILILCLNVADAFLIKRGFPTLKDQDAEISEMVSHLQSGDKIFAHGQTQALVLSGLSNASKYYFLDRGKDQFLDKVEQGGFDGWFDRLKAARPKIVALDRMKTVSHKDDFFAWVRADYDERKGRIFTYYLRKDAERLPPSIHPVD